MVIARKRFGQHFLEPAWVEKVVRAMDPKPDQLFIEIGPGAGALTRPLAARAHSLVAYEIDLDLAAALRRADLENVTVIEGDVLEQLRSPLLPEYRALVVPGSRSPLVPESASPHVPQYPGLLTLRVAGNLPYNVASPILFRLADLYAGGLPIADATVMLQREVADRLAAKPGTGEYGVLSVLMQHVAGIELLLKLPAGAFRPAPKVLSALVRLRFHRPDPPVPDPIVFAAVVQAVFTRQRKTLANALRAYAPAARGSIAGVLYAAGLDGGRRPETLTVAEFARLAGAL